jgi:hypothetical protein
MGPVNFSDASVDRLKILNSGPQKLRSGYFLNAPATTLGALQEEIVNY